MLKTWSCTCAGCPTQYEGYLYTGEFVYFRYRWGNVQFEIAQDRQHWYDDDLLFQVSQQIGDSYAGMLGDWEVDALVNRWLDEYAQTLRNE